MALCSEYLGCSPEHLAPYAQDGRLLYQQCADCGIIWRDPQSFDLEQPYDQQYFDSKNYQHNRAHKITKSTWLLDLALSHHPRIQRLLEVGCSVGNTLEAAQQKGIPHLGIDVSDFAVDYCTKRGLEATTQSLPDLIAQSQRFDLIFMQHVLEHFVDPFQVLQQCNQLLNNQGLVLILIPNSQYKRARKLRERHKFYSIQGVGIEHYAYFNYQNLERVLNATGYKVIQNNYPLRTLSHDSPSFIINRLGRRLLSLLGLDQELVVLAQNQN